MHRNYNMKKKKTKSNNFQILRLKIPHQNFKTLRELLQPEQDDL